MPKISIITINYNNIKGLKKTLSSVFNQSYQDFEYIVIDGESKDGSKELIRSNSDKLDYWVSEKDRGIYHAMNKGIERATGEYFLMLNSGDYLYSDTTLAKIAPLLYGEDIIYGNSHDVNFLSESKDRLCKYPSELTFNFFFTGALRHQATFIRKSLHDKIGGYDEAYKIVSDGKFLLHALASQQASYRHIDVTICSADMGGISYTNKDLSESEWQSVLREGFPFYFKDYKNYELYLKGEIPIDFSIKDKTLMSVIRKVIKWILPYGIVRIIQYFKFKKLSI